MKRLNFYTFLLFVVTCFLAMVQLSAQTTLETRLSQVVYRASGAKMDAKISH
jgi:hypothetical protein